MNATAQQTETLPITPRTARSGIRLQRPSTEPALVADDGDDVMVIAVAEGVSTIGRSFRADVELEDASVSRRHARLERQGRRVWVMDEGSANGVRVNGARVVRTRLRHGDTLQIGRVQLHFTAPRGV